MNSPFMLPQEQYVRQQDIVTEYVHTAALHRSRCKNIPYEEARAYVVSKVGEGKEFPIKSPEFQYAYSESRGNKVLGETNLWEYVSDVVNKDYLMAPSLTAYYPLDNFVTQTVPFLQEQGDKRQILKDIKFQAKLDGDYEAMESSDAGQATVKRYMNSVSGAYSVMSTTLFNFTGHSTLTSFCRLGTSIANANSERFISGLRHYHNVDVTISALYSAVTLSDIPATEAVMNKYELHYPTVGDVMECIKRSTKRAFRSASGMVEIENIVKLMKPTERAAFTYTSDFHHLFKHNREFITHFIEHHFAQPNTVATTREDASKVIKSLDSETFILACYLNDVDLKGVKFKDVEEKDELLPVHLRVANTGYHITQHHEKFRDFIETFLRPAYLPSSIYKLTGMVRQSSVYSDTDSTLSTGQAFVKELSPEGYFTKRGWHVGYVMSYLACQQLPHLHAMMSANLGVKGKDRFKFSMKNEYYIPLILLTGRVKNYAYIASAQEGNILQEPEFTLKGVSLRGITSSRLIAQKFEEFVLYIFKKVMEDGGLTVEEIFQPVLDVYELIVEDVRNNGYKYLKSVEVKESETYKKGDNDPNIKAKRMWEQVFAPVYGDAPELPYQSVSVNADITNKAKLDLWVSEMSNKELGERMREFVNREMRGSITTVRIPVQSILDSGVPNEIMSIIDFRKLTTGIMLPFYIILEGLGIYFLNEKLTRIINDEWVPTQLN